MAIHVVSILTSTSDLTFSSVHEWLSHHGVVGQNHQLVQDSNIVLSEDGTSIKRTLVYDNEQDMESHEALSSSDNPWIKELISKTVI